MQENSMTDTYLSEELEIHKLLNIVAWAEFLERNQAIAATEYLLLQALDELEESKGPFHPVTGLAIIYCIDFYDRNDRHDDSLKMAQRLENVAAFILSLDSQQ